MTSLLSERRRTRLASSCRSDLLRVSTVLATESLLCGPLAAAAGNVSGRLCCWRRGADVWIVLMASVPPLPWVSEGTAAAKGAGRETGEGRERASPLDVSAGGSFSWPRPTREASAGGARRGPLEVSEGELSSVSSPSLATARHGTVLWGGALRPLVRQTVNEVSASSPLARLWRRSGEARTRAGRRSGQTAWRVASRPWVSCGRAQRTVCLGDEGEGRKRTGWREERPKGRGRWKGERAKGRAVWGVVIVIVM